MDVAVIGAGAVGGVIGARLAAAGHRVVLVARGPHLDAIRAGGLELRSPEGSARLAIPAVASAADLPFRPDVALLATKTQDLAMALEALDPTLPVATATNGVDAERIAARRADRVYGVLVCMPATHLEPGVVQIHSTPPGVLDVGRFPSGSDAVTEALVAALRSAGFDSQVRDDITRWKYAKLLTNLGNALQAAVGLDCPDEGLLHAARAEAWAVFAAAGIEPVPADRLRQRTAALTMGTIDGVERAGGSTWQSLARATGSVEADHLNGEIALLGRLHGVPTPVNTALQRAVERMARRHAPPGSLTLAELRAEAGLQERFDDAPRSR